MEINTLQICLIFIVSFIAGMGAVLDEFQFHRPLITCALIGYILGDIKTGFIIGGTLEMISLGWMNVGAAVAPDAALASIISTILVIAGGQKIGSGIALAIPLAATGQVLTIIVRTLTIVMQHAADNAAKKNNLKTISFIHILALMIQAMRIAIPTLIFIFSIKSPSVNNILNSIPEYITTGLNISGGIIVVVGYAMVINMMSAAYLMPFFYAGFVIAAFTNFNLVALGMIGIIMAIIYIQLNPKYYKNKYIKNNDIKNSNIDDELD
ncbi:PTS mannose/fructose/sorbose transporter subunit IIC [Enterobacteriaceae bacterium ET-AT1-13]|nr:PTS mannose/fructose/sorbose transporter subunit IIC [Enterobacteriaceae bacterium ET-AT1-13]WGS66414.1 PTS mannose/fructose/sorbose transporter subunit IIC [Enterobacteriaceae bacterium Cmel17]WMC17438.1 MAG: PTS mannose/fructose/sorbose transporter subunit IIC [Enterobacteriaceae bacterium Cmel21]WMC17645.1 MAG: PTS mannose/fructose/sorbose transporter subunit IIC [Enterobacteriaceae bacterium PSmelAO3-2]WMC17849.1 MAG: PTS mannose/fructose/sorbose transporter subunit IIC [Enterobacteriace